MPARREPKTGAHTARTCCAAMRHFSMAIASGSPCSSGRSRLAAFTRNGSGWPASRIATTSRSLLALPVAKEISVSSGMAASLSSAASYTTGSRCVMCLRSVGSALEKCVLVVQAAGARVTGLPARHRKPMLKQKIHLRFPRLDSNTLLTSGSAGAPLRAAQHLLSASLLHTQHRCQRPGSMVRI